jgi:hypothetical protein
MKNLSYSYNDYLSSLDNNNKYNNKSLYLTPKIKSIILDIPLDQFLQKSNSYDIKIFYILFLFCNYKPYINFKKKTVIKIILLKKKLNFFLYNFFLYLSYNINNFKIKEKSFLSKQLNKKSLTLKIPIFYTYNLNFYFNKFFFDLNIKSLSLFIHLKYINIKHFESNIKTIYPFWN